MTDRETEDTAPEGVSWYKSPQILVALGGVSGGVVSTCHAFHIPLPFTEAEITEGLAGVLAIGASIYFIYRRYKAGADPANPTPKLTK